MKRTTAAAVFCALTWPALAAADVVKPPDIGPYWASIDPSEGTYVYADRFVAPATETITAVGTWLQILDGGGGNRTAPAGGRPVGTGATPNSARFELWASNAGAPDPSSVLGTTGSVTPPVDGTLRLFQYPLQAPVPLTAGTTYFFAVTVVGESGDTDWQTGGHTQNSVYNDNGRFWYSNDAAGLAFDGVDLLPEMAFAAITYQPPLIQAIPAAGPLGLALLAGAVGFAALRRLRRN
jgi:hypothetical protein